MISCSKQFLGIPTNGLYECIMNDFSGDFMLVILDVTSNEQTQFVNLLMTSQSVFLNNGTTRFRRSLNFLWRLLNLQIIILQVWRGYIILRYKRNGIIWRKYLSYFRVSYTQLLIPGKQLSKINRCAKPLTFKIGFNFFALECYEA